MTVPPDPAGGSARHERTARAVEERYRPLPLLRDKVVVLCGVGPGLGRSLGEEAARMGADLVLVGATERRLDRTAAAVRSHGRRALVVPADVTDEDERVRLVETVLTELGRIDCLVNNAFAIPWMDPLTTLPVESLRAANEANVFAPLRLAALFADGLAAAQGSIIMLNSCVQYSSEPQYAGHRLSQGTLAHLASSLATELGPRGIRVNSVAPSFIYEDVNTGYFDWLAAEAGQSHEDVYLEKAAATDLKRLASAQEVARATLFLASDLASAVTGTMLNIDCGEFHNI
ncbi:SDR family oxidoreductase [Nocardioides pantholopis]|uniref:SDR family oxidoreductase n=1 Tax=Nocardioides pantholopis TaxID=2483798 RepID=UPI000F080C8E|nr:SDR family oxidoreductase [Nocardioides pantholopis]